MRINKLLAYDLVALTLSSVKLEHLDAWEALMGAQLLYQFCTTINDATNVSNKL